MCLEFDAAANTPQPRRGIARLNVAAAAIDEARGRCFVGDIGNEPLQREAIIKLPSQTQIDLGKRRLPVKNRIDGLAEECAREIHLYIRRELSGAAKINIILR